MAWSSIYHHDPGDDSSDSHAHQILAHPSLTFVSEEKQGELVMLAQQLMLSIPDFAFTIEVDILGAHRVTVHFKGTDISIDAM